MKIWGDFQFGDERSWEERGTEENDESQSPVVSLSDTFYCQGLLMHFKGYPALAGYRMAISLRLKPERLIL
jgi:hypothetical protein